MKTTLEFRTTTKVEKYASEDARRRGDPPEVVEQTRVQRITPEQARALGFSEKDIQEALHGT
jgi:hypothetical protein